MIFDGIIVGGGHSGVEAALSMSKMGKKVALITGNLDKVSSLPCNPSIGGSAKGIVVREIDALGGIMGIAADYNQIQIKMLNSSKGPAVRALRAQIDKLEYPKYILKLLKSTNNLTLIEDLVDKLIVENGSVEGIITKRGNEFKSKTVILTTGTYLSSKILMGKKKTTSGPIGEPTTFGLSKQLKELGFELIRLKTGTPPRIIKDSINFEILEKQFGDDIKYTFSFLNKYNNKAQEPCYLTHTTPKTKEIILKNIFESPMYSGKINSTGPRYCPSIEDKVVRFENKDIHQVFIEPESLSLNEMYIQGLSTSFPEKIQEKIVHSIPGLENSVISKYAYAIEYDAINPIQLKKSLESKKIKNLFFAGQINGTSGYEEAASQGLIAGINASLVLEKKEPLILGRHQAYIGVLIDDLVTKGTSEPYRLLTSRAEFRLLLRHDNADSRLSEIGYNIGLLDKKKYGKFLIKKKKLVNTTNILKTNHLYPNKKTNDLLNSINTKPIKDKTSYYDILKRPEISAKHLINLFNLDVEKEIIDLIEVDSKYNGYINKSIKEANKMLRLENKIIPKIFDFSKIKNMSSEAIEKLNKIKPETVGQASRISGVNPVDINLLLIYIESGMHKKNYA